MEKGTTTQSRRGTKAGYPIGNSSQPRRIILGSESRNVKLKERSAFSYQLSTFWLYFLPFYAGSDVAVGSVAGQNGSPQPEAEG
jgi:hypothetical protein